MAQGVEQVGYPPAIDDGKSMQQHLAADHFGKQFTRRDAGFNLVFTGFDRGRQSLETRVEDPGPRLRDHALRGQLVGNAGKARLRLYGEGERSGQAQRFIQTAQALQHHDAAAGDESQQQQPGDKTDQHLHNRSNRALNFAAASKLVKCRVALPRHSMAETERMPTSALLKKISSAPLRSAQ